MALYNTSDGIYNSTITLDNVEIDIQTTLSELVIEIYDSLDNLIQQYSYPAQSGYTDINVSGSVAQFKIFSSNLSTASLGKMKYVRRLKKNDSDFPDLSYDETFVNNSFDNLINE